VSLYKPGKPLWVKSLNVIGNLVLWSVLRFAIFMMVRWQSMDIGGLPPDVSRRHGWYAVGCYVLLIIGTGLACLRDNHEKDR
jgi:hypothetical protein